VPDRVEAKSDEAKRFLDSLRDILGVPKSEVDAKLARSKARKRGERERQAKATSSTRKPKS
jgi:hypothetical protein